MHNFNVHSCFICGGGKACKLILMWNNDVNQAIYKYDNNFIDIYFYYVDHVHTYRFATMYGHPNHINKHLSCSLISNLHDINKMEDELFVAILIWLNTCMKNKVETLSF